MLEVLHCELVCLLAVPVVMKALEVLEVLEVMHCVPSTLYALSVGFHCWISGIHQAFATQGSLGK